MMPAMVLHFTGADGLRITADSLGPDDAPPVLLLHGGGQTRHAWGGLAEILAGKGFRAVSIDQRGHGQSAWSPEGRYALGDFASDVRAVCAALGRRPVLVGASLGGLASLLAEAEGPFARALVMVDIAHRLELEGVQRILGFMTENAASGFASLEEAADAVAAYLPHRKRPRDLAGLAKNLRLGDDGRYRWHWDPRFLEAGHGEDPAHAAARLRNAASALRLPTLLVRGGLSDVLSEEGAREFLELVPGARYADVGGAAHMVAGDRNDAFNAAVLAFLGELAPDGG